MGRHKRLFITSNDIPIDSEINDQSYELSATGGDQSAGTNYGDISVWDVGIRERMVYKPFKVWDLSSCSMSFRTILEDNASGCVNQCTWDQMDQYLV
ncbi:unnamed protein product [Lactuca saligna]|uniref:Uncharacterized protein n=1 Tax=Lactuca saligna TaxID=75948 RepID=A0AA35YSX8_LACSI|nr:unnamed protein product [Lactuca saligna]